ncbi:MAG: alpha/beta hydrolase [Xanthomonadales bacterium]|nr:alpha/beta hydrolase [Xanthomonadales bacterium]
MSPLPFKTWGKPTSETPIYFAHANAYPPDSYQPIIDALAEQRQVVSYLQRPLWQPTPALDSIDSWWDFADDVIQFFDENNMKNVVAVGHSMGAVTAFMAAQKRPDLIKALVMIEPVALSWFACWLTRVFPKTVKARVNIIAKALGRPNRFESKQAAFDFHRKPRAFKRISDENLMHYINAGVTQQGDEYHLTYPREWEARVYATATYFRGQLLKSKLPVLAMRGGYSDTISADFWKKWQQNTNHQFVAFEDCGHLLPLENPEAVIAEILPFVEKHLRTL